MDSYEKKYKEALAHAREIHRNEVEKRRDMEFIFPELAESEDERIRKFLIEDIKDTLSSEDFKHYNSEHTKKLEEALAWLEKQGELSICNIPSREVILAIWDLGNEWKELTNGCISTEYGTQLKYIQKHWQESEYYLRVMQDKQNHVDTVEPKFKVGDWVVSDVAHEDYRICKILSDNDGEYIIESIYGYRGHNSFETFDKDYRLWSIQDAKDGDVLIDKSNGRECPFIFKETKPSDIKTDVPNPLTVLGYCGIGGAGFTKGSGWGDTANCIYYPATKEQRDLLSSKMREAGYEWDAYAKELMKIEQSSAWGEEDTFKVQRICKYLDEAKKYYADITEVRECMDWLKSLKKKNMKGE